MWKPPKAISDGLNTWRVSVVKRIPGERGKGYEVFGLTDTRKMRIYLLGSLDPQRMEQTFWHEVVHALFSSVGVDNENEAHVDGLGNAMQRFMASNPALLRDCARRKVARA